MATPIQVVFDCADPNKLATFWATALGYKIQNPPPGFATWEQFLEARGVPKSEWNSRSAVVDPEGKGPRIFFQRVPENKVVKNRVHLDVIAAWSPGAEAEVVRQRIYDEVERLQRAGATRVQEYDEMGSHWVVMRDPEGNEFCVS